MQMPSKKISLPFIKKEKIAQDTFLFYFDRSNSEFNFLPGQYIRIIFPSLSRYDSRFFTISSSPLEKEYLIIATKIGTSEFKQSLFSLQPGTDVSFFGPNGGIFLDEKETSERVFLAGGLGIVPFYSMITYAAEKKLTIPMTLFVSFSYVEDMMYFDALQTIAEKFPNINIIYTITKPNDSWEGETGRISEKLLRKYISDITNPVYSIVGFPEMVTDTEELLENMGVNINKIKIEPFTGY